MREERTANAGAGCAVLVLAAGEGKRMRSSTPKMLHPLLGRPLLDHVLDAAQGLGPERIAVVIGHGADAVREHYDGKPVRLVHQAEQLGSGHAVLCARDEIRDFEGTVLILYGDVPLLTRETLERLLTTHRENETDITVLTALLDDPSGYGRIVSDKVGRLLRIVEERDATTEERRIREVNSGLYAVNARFLFSALNQVKNDNIQGEYYLTDIVEIAVREGAKAQTMMAMDPWEVRGVNDRVDLEAISRRLQDAILDRLMREGVTVLDRRSVRVEADVQIGRDSVIHPGASLCGETIVGQGCVIEAGANIINTRVGDRVHIKPYCVITDSVVEEGASVGPWAHLRPESHIEAGAKVGNFVEVKKARIGRGSKVNHLSYIGDAEIGKEVNVGAGCITCNYDGEKKHKTVIEDGAFIGSDTQFVAPVRVGKGAYVGSGSTVTRDVPPGALAVARGRQKNIEGWTKRKKQKSKP